MTKPLTVSIPHSLGKEEATRRLKAGIARATTDIPLIKIADQTWVGDQLSFRVGALGQTANGKLEVGEDTVRLEVMLPALLQKFATTVQDALSKRTRGLLEKK